MEFEAWRVSGKVVPYDTANSFGDGWRGGKRVREIFEDGETGSSILSAQDYTGGMSMYGDYGPKRVRGGIAHMGGCGEGTIPWMRDVMRTWAGYCVQGVDVRTRKLLRARVDAASFRLVQSVHRGAEQGALYDRGMSGADGQVGGESALPEGWRVSSSGTMDVEPAMFGGSHYIAGGLSVYGKTSTLSRGDDRRAAALISTTADCEPLRGGQENLIGTDSPYCGYTEATHWDPYREAFDAGSEEVGMEWDDYFKKLLCEGGNSLFLAEDEVSCSGVAASDVQADGSVI
jgi:hypothetical protein